MIGQDFFVRAIVTNKTEETKEFRVQLRGNAMLYTGAAGQSVKSGSWTFSLGPKESEWLSTNLLYCLVNVTMYIHVL